MGLIHDPTIVLCDEPTPGLDPQSRIAVWDFIKKLPENGKTVILSTHYMEEADRLSNRVAIIDHGKLLVLDTPKNLKSSIGEGDLVEIDLMALSDESRILTLINQLKNDDPTLAIQEVRISGQKLSILALDIVPKLSRILGFLEKQGITVDNLSLRGTTLEDVFIDLTGRRLRS